MLKQVQFATMKLSKYLLSIVLMFASTLTLADDTRYYDIEVIIFESLDDNARISENWPHEVTLDIPALAVDLGQPYPGPLPKQFDPKLTFKVTPASQLQLLAEAKLLTESRNYRVLLHTGWRQPGMDVDTALPVHINQQFIMNETGKTPASSGPLTSPAYSQYQTRSVLNGYIKVILSRYLHMDVKLAYTTNIPLVTETGLPAKQLNDPNATPLSLPKPVVFYLEETRKMRSKEVHFLDHPVLGVLLLATPYEPGR